MKPRIIGLTGPICAGKGTAVDVLERDFGFVHIASREFVEREARRQGLPLDRETLQRFGASYSHEKGSEIWMRKAMQSIQRRDAHRDALGLYVVEAFRTLSQIELFDEFYRDEFYLLGIDAFQETRWARMNGRARSGDPIRRKDFLLADARDRGIGAFAHNGYQQTDACMKRAYTVLVNDSKENAFRKQIRAFMREQGYERVRRD